MTSSIGGLTVGSWSSLYLMEDLMGPKEDRSKAAALLGREGGPARAKALTAARALRDSEQGASARWGKKKRKEGRA